MNKKILIIIFSIIILIVIFFLWTYLNADEEVVNEIKEIVPQEEISDEQLRSTNILLYFVNKDTGEIEVESRLIDAKILLEDPCKQLLNLWILGPNNEKLDTYCSKNIKINNIEIIDNCAIVDLSKEFIDGYTGIEELNLKVIYCIVNTLTELKEVESVKILIDGQQNEYLGNINLYENYYRLSE